MPTRLSVAGAACLCERFTLVPWFLVPSLAVSSGVWGAQDADGFLNKDDLKKLLGSQEDVDQLITGSRVSRLQCGVWGFGRTRTAS